MGDALRRLLRDYERLPQHTEAMFTVAAITLMSRRLTRQPACPPARLPACPPARLPGRNGPTPAASPAGSVTSGCPEPRTNWSKEVAVRDLLTPGFVCERYAACDGTAANLARSSRHGARLRRRAGSADGRGRFCPAGFPALTSPYSRAPPTPGAERTAPHRTAPVRITPSAHRAPNRTESSVAHSTAVRAKRGAHRARGATCRARCNALPRWRCAPRAARSRSGARTTGRWCARRRAPPAPRTAPDAHRIRR